MRFPKRMRNSWSWLWYATAMPSFAQTSAAWLRVETSSCQSFSFSALPWNQAALMRLQPASCAKRMVFGSSAPASVQG